MYLCIFMDLCMINRAIGVTRSLSEVQGFMNIEMKAHNLPACATNLRP